MYFTQLKETEDLKSLKGTECGLSLWKSNKEYYAYQ